MASGNGGGQKYYLLTFSKVRSGFTQHAAIDFDPVEWLIIRWRTEQERESAIEDTTVLHWYVEITRDQYTKLAMLAPH